MKKIALACLSIAVLATPSFANDFVSFPLKLDSQPNPLIELNSNQGHKIGKDVKTAVYTSGRRGSFNIIDCRGMPYWCPDYPWYHDQ